MRITLILALFALILAACGAPRGPIDPSEKASEPAGAGLRVGTGSFVFTGSAGAAVRPVTVHYHRAASLTPDSPILFVMHGNGRNADGYRNVWIPLAEEHGFLLVVPEFSREHYPSSRHYHQGNIMEASGEPVDSARWSFVTVEAIFDEVRERSGSTRSRYSIYGHSAGSQFVHRMLLLMPEARIEEAFAANAGWYTFPTGEEEWPYGLGGVVTEEELRVRLRSALARRVTVLLGEADTVTNHRDLRTTPEAMAQGIHRFERGHSFYAAAEAMATALELPFEWTVRTVPDVAHSNRGMAPAAAAALSW